jgi:hypothetical protein
MKNAWPFRLADYDGRVAPFDSHWELSLDSVNELRLERGGVLDPAGFCARSTSVDNCCIIVVYNCCTPTEAELTVLRDRMRLVWDLAREHRSKFAIHIPQPAIHEQDTSSNHEPSGKSWVFPQVMNTLEGREPSIQS